MCTIRFGILLAVLSTCFRYGYGIDCFKCVSHNGNNAACDDPFHNNVSTAFLEAPCMGGRKGRDGLFPATACIKIAGHFVDTGESITVRGCALDSGTLTTDTELIRMSHCGRFYYEDRYVKGCLQSCGDSDGCNLSNQNKLNIFALISGIFVSRVSSSFLYLR
ncbi:hypothetical protein HA402_013555 [Bradysia odoriphaga]|nr:hypothetical protein HA402_013555 [Bradysia odoriphaga]